MKLPKPVLQKFTEEDDVASFLYMFERVASLHKCPKTMRATQLSGVLSGKALKAFSSLPTEKSMKKKSRCVIQSCFILNLLTSMSSLVTPDDKEKTINTATLQSLKPL